MKNNIISNLNKNSTILSNKKNNLSESKTMNSPKVLNTKSSSCSNLFSNNKKDKQDYDNLNLRKKTGKTTSSSEKAYLKNQNSLKNYFKQNINSIGLKLGYDKYYETIPIEKYVNEINKYNNNITNQLIKYPDEENKKIKNNMKLTPLPSKSRLLMNSDKEKKDFNNAERTAVMMRRFEYTHRLKNKENKKAQEKKAKYLIMKKAVEKIEIWWKKILDNKKKSGYINDNKRKYKDYSNKIEKNKKISFFFDKVVKFYNIKIKFIKKDIFKYFIEQLKKNRINKFESSDINKNFYKESFEKINKSDNITPKKVYNNNNYFNNNNIENNGLKNLENELNKNYNHNPIKSFNKDLIINLNNNKNIPKTFSNNNYLTYQIDNSSSNNFLSDNSNKNFNDLLSDNSKKSYNDFLSEHSKKSYNDFHKNNQNINYDSFQIDNVNKKNNDFLEDNLNKKAINFQEYNSNVKNDVFYKDNSIQNNIFPKKNLKENENYQQENLNNYFEEPNLNYLKILPTKNKLIKSNRESLNNNQKFTYLIEKCEKLKNNTFNNNNNLFLSYDTKLNNNNEFNDEGERINIFKSNKPEKLLRKSTPNYDRRNKSTYNNDNNKNKNDNLSNNNIFSNYKNNQNSKSQLIALKRGNIHRKKNDENLNEDNLKKYNNKGKNYNDDDVFSDLPKNDNLNENNNNIKYNSNLIEKTKKIVGLSNDNLKERNNLNLYQDDIIVNSENKEVNKLNDNNILNNDIINNNIILFNENKENDIQENKNSDLENKSKEISFQEIIEKNKNGNYILNQNNNNKEPEKINQTIKKEKINNNLKEPYKTPSKQNSQLNSENQNNYLNSYSNQSSNLKSYSSEKDKIIKSENFWVKYYQSPNKFVDHKDPKKNINKKKSQNNNLKSPKNKIIIEEKNEYLNNEYEDFPNTNKINNINNNNINNDTDITQKEDLLNDKSPQKIDIVEFTRRKLYGNDNNYNDNNNNINKFNKIIINISQNKNDDNIINNSYYNNNIDENNFNTESPKRIFGNNINLENQNSVNFNNYLINNEIVNRNINKNEKSNPLKISSSHISFIQRKDTLTKENKVKILILLIESRFKIEFFNRIMVFNYLSKNKINLDNEELKALLKIGKKNTYQRILNNTLGVNIVHSNNNNQNVPFKDWVQKFTQKKINSTEESFKSKGLNKNNNKNKYKTTNINELIFQKVIGDNNNLRKYNSEKNFISKNNHSRKDRLNNNKEEEEDDNSNLNPRTNRIFGNKKTNQHQILIREINYDSNQFY